MNYFNGFSLNGYVGRWEAWALIAGAWIIASIVTAITFGVIARFGGRKGRERNEYTRGTR